MAQPSRPGRKECEDATAQLREGDGISGVGIAFGIREGGEGREERRGGIHNGD